MPYSFKQELELAREVGEAAGAIQLESARTVHSVVCKGDNSPVTEIDKKCEELIRERILKAYPADGFIGEETGEHAGSSGRTWIVDPLDGTRPYIHGIPTYSVLIALHDGSTPVVGVAHLPGMKLTGWACSGEGAYINNERVQVSTEATIGRAFCSGFGALELYGTLHSEQLIRCMRSWDYAYGFMDVYSYLCVASGKLDGCVNLLDKPWDCAAAACIVAEAGGRFSDIDGKATVFGGSIIMSNSLLHDQLVAFFSGAG